MAAMAGIMKALGAKTTKTIGNFWKYLVLSCTRILFPLSLIVGFILITQGTPMGFDGKMEITTMEGATQNVSQGPTAAIVPIKQLGTNGGGYFGCKLFSSVGKPDLSVQHDGMLVHPDSFRWLWLSHSVSISSVKNWVIPFMA